VILEQAVLDVRRGEERSFELAFATAQRLLAMQRGYLGHELWRGAGRRGRYLLLVRWETLEDHTEGFRGSADYAQWKALLHHFYEPFPEVEHYAPL
jgi:heme-degrading monooxygenase HmoA